MNAFQIIFTPTSAVELARMPKDLQLQILGEFRGLPQQVIGTELDDFGRLERGGRSLHRFRVGDYRVYFERHDLGVLVHRILSRHTLKDFLFRSGLKVQEDEALQENPKFWEMIAAATREAPPGICIGATMTTLSARTSAQAFCGSIGQCETNGTR